MNHSTTEYPNLKRTSSTDPALDTAESINMETPPQGSRLFAEGISVVKPSNVQLMRGTQQIEIFLIYASVEST